MWHMPYERMTAGDGPDDTPETPAPRREAESEESTRTPQSAEGLDGEERRTPQGEPGFTPGSAEGEDFDEPSRH